MNPIIVSPVLFLGYFQLGVQSQSQQLFLVLGIIELLLQLLCLIRDSYSVVTRKPHFFVILTQSLFTLDRWSAFMLSMMRLF